MDLTKHVKIITTEMHTAGEPLRIIESGYPEIMGATVLEKRSYVRNHLDHLRKFLMYEPRGHYNMYGVLIVEADHPDAHFGVLFMHNEGYSTMCGHAVIALGRYAVDMGMIKAATVPQVEVKIQCPSGLVRAFVEYDGTKTGSVHFHSVPAFAFAIDAEIDVKGFSKKIQVDIGFGGAFYGILPAQRIGLDLHRSRTQDLIDGTTAVTDAIKAQIKLHHPESMDLAFCYGTILTDGEDAYTDKPTVNMCVFALREVDRSPTGSGVTARLAVQYKRGLITLHQTRTFESVIGSQFTGQVVKETTMGEFAAVVVEVGGKGHYTGSATFTLENDDQLKQGFLLN